jgi:hypothetical protein
MLTRYVALVSEVSQIGAGELSEVAAALQKQAIRDFGPIWGVQASVAAFECLERVPLDYWPIIVKEKLEDRPEAEGYHEDHLSEPCALVLYNGEWSLTASHEMLEMLADPWGRHMVAGQSPADRARRVKFLVEVCDPCSDGAYAYHVNGVKVSDFYTPRFFDPVRVGGVRYSFAGAITEPRQVLKGGYLTWHDPEQRQWWQRAWFDGASHKDTIVDVPHIVQGANIRATIDHHMRAAKRRGPGDFGAHSSPPSHYDRDAASRNRADDIRTALNNPTRNTPRGAGR